MYNRHAQNYNPYRKRRHARIARKNPTATNYIGAQPDSFNSISAARAFLLQHSDPCSITAQGKDLVRLKQRIKNAKRIVRRADKRNLRRRVQAAVKKLAANCNAARRNPDESVRCKACGEMFEDFDPDTHCQTCGRERKDPQQECAEARKSIFEASMQTLLNAEQNIQKVQNLLLRYARQAAKKIDGDELENQVINTVLEEFTRAVDESGERGRIPEGPPTENYLFEDDSSDFQEALPELAIHTVDEPHSWERVLGPEGETIIFQIDRSGKNIKVTAVSNPRFSDGDLILDLRRGIHAFQVRGTSEVPVKVTPDMWEHYKGSYLYKVRKLAAGWRHSSFSRAMKKALEGKKKPSFAKKRKLRRKKNRKK